MRYFFPDQYVVLNSVRDLEAMMDDLYPLEKMTSALSRSIFQQAEYDDRPLAGGFDFIFRLSDKFWDDVIEIFDPEWFAERSPQMPKVNYVDPTGGSDRLEAIRNLPRESPVTRPDISPGRSPNFD